METKPVSRAPCTFAGKVKNLLIKAWRERWSENQWGVHLKKILASENGDAKELPEILLQQALVGPNPSTIILNYLKHIVLAQMVPPSSAFTLIQKYDDMSKPYCILGLIDLAETFAGNLSFTSGLDSSVTLCKCLQNILHWLMLCILQALQCLKDTRQQQEYITIIDNASIATQKIADSGTVQALLFVAMTEDTDKFREFEQTVVNVRGTLSQPISDVLPSNTKQKVVTAVHILSKVQDLVLPAQSIIEVSNLPICPTVNTLIALESILNPTNDVQPFVEQLRVTETLLKLTRPYLFCEMIRACLMGLVNVVEGPEELKWAAFTYLKLPQILIKISQQDQGPDFSRDLVQGFDMLLNSVPLLDLVDNKLNCDCLEYLLIECNKYDLMNKSQLASLMQRRSKETGRSQRTESSTQSSPGLIIRAEPTVNSILKTLHVPPFDSSKESMSSTLDADCSKNQDALMAVLCHMLSGKSFDLILAAAAANGKLKSFASKLIKINEFAKLSQGEAGKGAQTRALLFDITFLMLCHITQLHGLEIITCSPDSMDSFFVQWAMRCLPEEGKYKCVDNFAPPDQSKVDMLIGQLTTGADIKFSLTRWHEICTNSPMALQEVLFAWEHNALSADNVKVILERCKGKMCCIPVVMSTWLCSYMNTVGEEAREKPIQMLQHLQTKVMNPDPDIFYNERSHLMVSILRVLSNDILPVNLRINANQYVPTTKLPSEVMDEALKNVFQKGWLDLQDVHTFEQILNLCGSDWFCERAVKAMLENTRVEDLTKALSLVYAIFHMDLEHLALSLMLHTLPKFLQSTHYSNLLTDPRGYTLAKLCVMIFTAAQTSRTAEKDNIPHLRRGRKRSRKEVELDDVDETECRPVKRSKSSSIEPQLTFESEGFNFEFLTAKEDGETSPTFDTKDPLNKALANLMRLMNAVSQSSEVCPRIGFIVNFIKEVIKCGSQYARGIRQFMPPQMVSHLMKSDPGVFDNQQILHICDLSTSMGRKVASKAICQNSKIKRISTT